MNNTVFTAPFAALLEPLGFVLEGGGAAPYYWCFDAPAGDVRITDTSGDVDVLSEADWLLGVYIGDAGETGAEFFERPLAFDLSSEGGLCTLAVAAGAAVRFVQALAPITATDRLQQAALAVVRQRDHWAEFGTWAKDEPGPSGDQCFDDWAADLLETAMGSASKTQARANASNDRGGVS